MMTSIWNDQEITQQFSKCATLREVISELEDQFSSRGEVICEIRVNGILLSEDDELKFADSPREEIRDLAILSNRPADLILESLSSVDGFIPQLEEQTLRTADLFRGADLLKAQHSFTETLDGCKWLFDTIVHIRSAAHGIGDPIQQEDKWFNAEKKIMGVVRDVSQAYSNGDLVLVADLLEYEMTSGFGLWREILRDEHGWRSSGS